MNKILYLMVLSILTLSMQSCIKNYTIVGAEEYEHIYRIEDIDVSMFDTYLIIVPKVSYYNNDFDAESRAFYSSIDSSLSYTGKVYSRAFNGGYHKVFSAVDWRLNILEVTTLEDFDELHPAGSSLSDLIEIRYNYKHAMILRPLSDIQYGTMMVTDYFPEETFDWYSDLTLCLYKSPVNNYREIHECARNVPPLSFGEVPFPSIEIRLSDAFGREFVKQCAREKIDEPTL